MGRKFHHDYSQSDAANQRYRCNPLWRTQLGSGKVSSSSNSSSRTSRTRSSSGGSGSGSSSSSSEQDKTRQDKTRQGKARQGKTRQGKTNSCSISGDTLAIPRRYPKWKTGTPRRQSPSSFQHNHISKFQKGKPNTIQFPMELTH